jgi:hypothetical protein
MVIDEAREVEHYERYWQENKGKMDAVSLQATWLALKGAVTVKQIPNGVRIDRVLAKYPAYNVILQRHTDKYRLSPEEIKERYAELTKYAMMKFGRSLSAN